MYANGLGGLAKDDAEAARWYKRAADQGNATAKQNLARLQGNERATGFVVLPKRWIVERTFAWLGRDRRLAKDVETLIASSTAMLYLAACSSACSDRSSYRAAAAQSIGRGVANGKPVNRCVQSDGTTVYPPELLMQSKLS